MLSNYLPNRLKIPVCGAMGKVQTPQEVRFRAGRPITITNGTGEFFVGGNGEVLCAEEKAISASAYELQEIVELLASNSVYAAKEDLKKGFLTIEGGHRAGFCGKGVVLNGKIEYLKEVSSINVRIARQVKGCGDSLMEEVASGGIRSTLIISPPGCGKTTLLRDLARQISDRGSNVSIVDERSEISPMAGCCPIFDVGKRTDVLTDCPKAVGMMMVLRTMNPDVIVTDEIGTREDGEALLEIGNAGVKVIASFHGFSLEDFEKRVDFSRIKRANIFERIVVLSKRNGVGTVETVIRM